MTGEEEDLVGELSPPVAAAVEGGVEMVESVIGELLEAKAKEAGG